MKGSEKYDLDTVEGQTICKKNLRMLEKLIKALTQIFQLIKIFMQCYIYFEINLTFAADHNNFINFHFLKIYIFKKNILL